MKILKLTEKSSKSINILISGPNYHYDTVIEPVISYDKLIDVMGLNDNYLNCKFININTNVENQGGKKRGEKV